MASILRAWELGGGWGHLMRLMPIAGGLVARGHRVCAALRDLRWAIGVFGDDVALLQAPLRFRPFPGEAEQPMTLAHILAKTGFGEARELAGLCQAWRGIFDYVKPDLMISDHSPTALLASRGQPFKRCAIGTGFTCPPDERPLPNLRYWETPDTAQLLCDEERILQNMNSVIPPSAVAPLSHVTSLYAELDMTFLMTVHELDHYPNRIGAEYWGDSTSAAGEPPVWPDNGHGPRVYGYLKSFAKLPDLLGQLNAWQFPTLIYSDEIDPKIVRQFTSSTLHFAKRRLALNDVGRQCDLAIIHGTHGATMAMLMAGKPTLQLPIYLEQVLMSQAVRRMGAGLASPISESQMIINCLRKMADSTEYASAAQGFANKYAQSNPLPRNEQILDRLEALLRA